MYHCPFTTTSYPRTAQEILDGALAHLIAQGHRSLVMPGGVCAYRGANADACPGGWLIPDALYDHEMEEKMWYEVTSGWPELDTMYGEHEKLIDDLQDAHDEAYEKVETFKEAIAYALRDIADEHGLVAGTVP